MKGSELLPLSKFSTSQTRILTCQLILWHKSHFACMHSQTTEQVRVKCSKKELPMHSKHRLAWFQPKVKIRSTVSSVTTLPAFFLLCQSDGAHSHPCQCCFDMETCRGSLPQFLDVPLQCQERVIVTFSEILELCENRQI